MALTATLGRPIGEQIPKTDDAMTCEAEEPRDEDTTEAESSELIWTNNAPNRVTRYIKKVNLNFEILPTRMNICLIMNHVKLYGVQSLKLINYAH
jgi:hypothetical protein